MTVMERSPRLPRSRRARRMHPPVGSELTRGGSVSLVCLPIALGRQGSVSHREASADSSFLTTAALRKHASHLAIRARPLPHLALVPRLRSVLGPPQEEQAPHVAPRARGKGLRGQGEHCFHIYAVARLARCESRVQTRDPNSAGHPRRRRS